MLSLGMGVHFAIQGLVWAILFFSYPLFVAFARAEARPWKYLGRLLLVLFVSQLVANSIYFVREHGFQKGDTIESLVLFAVELVGLGVTAIVFYWLGHWASRFLFRGRISLLTL
jgi:tryptophan-rich sensory protein